MCTHKNFTCDIQYADEITWSLKKRVISHNIQALFTGDSNVYFHCALCRTFFFFHFYLLNREHSNAKSWTRHRSTQACVDDHMGNASVRPTHLIYHIGMKLKAFSLHFVLYCISIYFVLVFTWKTNYIKLRELNSKHCVLFAEWKRNNLSMYPDLILFLHCLPTILFVLFFFNIFENAIPPLVCLHFDCGCFQFSRYSSSLAF